VLSTPGAVAPQMVLLTIDKRIHSHYITWRLVGQVECFCMSSTMAASRPRSRRFESAVSVGLLGVLVLVAVAVLIRQYPRTADQTPVPDLVSLTPSGFAAPSATGAYDRENLYEKIDGKAPLYIDSGFVKLFVQRYVDEADPNISAELYVYDMGRHKNAFSIYSVQKRPGVAPLAGVKFGYKTENALYFVHGKYYVEFVAYARSEKLIQTAEAVATRLRARLDVSRVPELDELKLFPAQGRIAGSEKLYLQNAFGFEPLTDTFACRYQIDGAGATAFVSRRSNASQARALAKEYGVFLRQNGAQPKASF